MPVPPDDLSHDPRTSAVTVDVGGAATPASFGSTRFVPGSVVAGRYRLVALLGRGGMGEVYRADDLTLNQTVALKVLPRLDRGAGGADDTARLARLHNELRIARQVSHKNVCRLYDIGDADGRRFLTMEYVDGEDLASLLRRIGRIPQDKAIQIARQLCAGVAAAHERGVLHRDLKPSNVMIDGDGNVRITDFGIATATGDAGTDIAGTPQYMAPEQFTGHPASIKTDIYALGLILFELFTGRRVNDAKTIGDVRQLHETGSVTLPSSIVRDLDPAVERVILRCLERDPDRRPASALAVAAALPGGDPLAAALAAGETPSPDLLVAAGESEAFAIVPALSMAVSFVVVLLVFAAFASRASLAGLVPMDKPRDVLVDRTVQVIRSLGYQSVIADRVSGFAPLPGYLAWAQRSGPADWWKSLGSGTPPALLFWSRTSPRDFIPVRPAGAVTPIDPPMNVSGMHQIFLDTRGRLVEFHSVPPQVETEKGLGDPPPWRKLFDEAELNFDAFTPAAPQWTPRDYGDTRAAWEGPLSERQDVRVRVEAASFRGLPVSFQIVGPWTQATRMQPLQRTVSQRVGIGLFVGVWSVLLLGAIFLARRNLRENRADRTGAARLGIGLTAVSLTSSLLSAQHALAPELELNTILSALAFAARVGGVVWVLYLAAEPYARRFWPDGLLGWTRLLSGRFRDSRVGHDILVGLAFAGAELVLHLARLLPSALGRRAPLPPFGGSLSPLMETSLLLARILEWLSTATQSGLAAAVVFVVFLLLFKRSWLALIPGIVVLLFLKDNGSAVSGSWMDIAFSTVLISMLTFALYRYGLLVLVVSLFVGAVVQNVPLTLNPSLWWATPSNLTLTLFIALAGFAYYAARAGQPLLWPALKDAR
ncbi:MAG: serine/threonine-protein kinase [Acidobacteriota bacterium]